MKPNRLTNWTRMIFKDIYLIHILEPYIWSSQLLSFCYKVDRGLIAIKGYDTLRSQHQIRLVTYQGPPPHTHTPFWTNPITLQWIQSAYSKPHPQSVCVVKKTRVKDFKNRIYYDPFYHKTDQMRIRLSKSVLYWYYIEFNIYQKYQNRFYIDTTLSLIILSLMRR